MKQREIKYMPPSSLRADPANARTHSDKQIAQLARSITTFGFNNPILVDREAKIVAGHGRVLAAIALGIDAVPTIRLDHLTPEEVRAYAIADNRLAELAGWDKEILALELGELLELDLAFDVTDLGFEMGEIDVFLATSKAPAKPGAEEDVPDADDVPRVARPGDLWQAGRHLVFCGDALDADSYRMLLAGEEARMVFTDPPYNVPINGHVSGLGKNKHPEFVQGSGELSDQDFRNFLKGCCAQMRAFSADGSMHFICMDWRHIDVLLEAGKSMFSELKNICVWVKSNGGMGSLYRSQHELVAVFKSGSSRHCNNVELGAHGRYRTNVWEYEGMSGFQAGRKEKLAMHPTVKPVGMIADAIMDCSNRRDIVLDPFAGSGSTLIACERSGRACRAIELDPRYVDVILARFLKVTGIPPIHLWTGQTYASRQACASNNRKAANGGSHVGI